MRKIIYDITEKDALLSIERFLKREHNYSSRTIIKLKHYDEGIKLNGTHARTVDILSAGDRLEITFIDAEEHGVKQFIRSNKKVSIAYEDSDIIVFNKPAGMPCHQSCGHAADTLANVFAAHCDALGLDIMYRPLNRLDRDTTGAVVVAKNRYAAAITSNMTKTYQAILQGNLEQKEGSINLPIRREYPEEMRRIVAEDGKRSVTHYKVVSENEGFSLVDFNLETGRTHQIRVHMAYIGHPVLGDEFYGGSTDLLKTQALHCREVKFRQPVTGEEIRVECPEPEEWHIL